VRNSKLRVEIEGNATIAVAFNAPSSISSVRFGAELQRRTYKRQDGAKQCSGFALVHWLLMSLFSDYRTYIKNHFKTLWQIMNLPWSTYIFVKRFCGYFLHEDTLCKFYVLLCRKHDLP